MRNSRSHYFGADEKARIEIIPMIDIMMFLLVFFMIITLKMIEGAGITLELPKAASAQKLQAAQIVVGVMPDGRIVLEGIQVSEQQLLARLRAARTLDKVDVVIAGDKSTSYQAIIKVMDVVRAAGIDAVALTTSAL